MQNIVTLGEINDALKIAAVTAAQLADMGFAALANKPICEGLPPEESRRLRNAKLYPAESIGQIRVALAQRLAAPATMQASVSNATCQAAPAAVTEPDGWRLVPVDPTEQMEQAAADYLGECVKAWGLWKAMITSAPECAALAATPAAAAEVPQGSYVSTSGELKPDVSVYSTPAAAPVVLPEPDFQLKWSASAGRYSFSKPLTGDVDCYTADTVRALLATATGLPAQAAKPSGLLTVDEYQAKYLHIHKMSDDERYGYESLYNEIVSGLQMPAAAPQAQAFQQRVQPWMMACFGPEISADSRERNHRFLEEALELVQSCGCTASEAHQLVEYVFGRPVGDPMQEAGGVMVTLAALGLANDLDMHACAETELVRIWTKVEAIRAKQAAKPKHSPLPMHAAQTLDDSALLDAMERQRIAVVPEYEGPWDAEVYNDEGEPIHAGSGSTPREAIRAAIAAAKGE